MAAATVVFPTAAVPLAAALGSRGVRGEAADRNPQQCADGLAA